MKTNKAFTIHQMGALVTLIVVLVWCMWVLWTHMVRPLGLVHIEMLFLSALFPIYLILVPFYGLRLRWSYISGIVAMLGLFAGLLKSILDNSFFFSFSAYNLTTLLVFFCALLCIYFSLHSYLTLPSVGWFKSALGIGIMLGISGLAVWQVSANQMEIENNNLERVIHGVQSRTGEIEDLDDKIEALMAEGDMHSLVAAIVVNDQVVWTRAYGADPDVDKIYDMGSITKSFMASVVLQLYERGIIDLNDDVNQYLPFTVRHPNYPDKPITIRMLLTNRSCLAHNTALYQSYSMGPSLRQWGVEQRGWEYNEEFERLSYPEFMAGYLEPGGPYYQPENWVNCQPGTEFFYSTPGFDLLGYLVEQVSGQPIEGYLQQNIFAPLGMTSTTATPLDTPERIAVPHERWYGVLAKTNVQLPLSQRRLIGGGGLYTTVEDLSNFLIAHMNQGELDGFQLLQPKTVNLMHSRASSTMDDFMQVGYGYGWSLYQEESRQMWDITYQPRGYQGHGGRYWGYSSQMQMVAEEDGAYGFVMLINTSMVEAMDYPWIFAIQYNIQDLILQEAYRMYQDS
jgi:CubicO group peptidase (beta-lactamase class C family)